MNEMKDTEQVIERVNKYLSLIRYKYSSLEKLSRLHIINDYYVTHEGKSSAEHLTCKIQSAEELSSGLKITIKSKRNILIRRKTKRQNTIQLTH